MTTPYYIKIAPTAAEQIKQLPPKQRRLIMKLIDALCINPRPPGTRKIEGMTGLYSETINHSRLIYKIEEHDIVLLLVK